MVHVKLFFVCVCTLVFAPCTAQTNQLTQVSNFTLTWKYKNLITLQWITETEQNNYNFEIWANSIILATVPSFNNGYSQSPTLYRYSVKLPATKEKYIISLKQIDYNNKSKMYFLSTPLSVHSDLNNFSALYTALDSTNTKLLINLTNPTNQQFVYIYVFDLFKNEITRDKIKTPPHTTITTSMYMDDLPTGVYTVIADWKDYFEFSKVIYVDP